MSRFKDYIIDLMEKGEWDKLPESFRPNQDSSEKPKEKKDVEESKQNDSN
jgi:hypothetical protein